MWPSVAWVCQYLALTSQEREVEIAKDAKIEQLHAQVESLKQELIQARAQQLLCVPQLPDELLLMIMKKLVGDIQDMDDTSWKDLETLASACCAGSHLRTVTEPLLYCQFMKPHDGWHDADESPKHQNPNRRLRQFLRSIIQRPSLGAHVRTLSIGSWSTSDTLLAHAQPVTPCPPRRDLVELYNHAISQLTGFISVQLAADCRLALQAGDEDAEVALLMTLLPNVQTVHMELNMDFEVHYACYSGMLFRRFLQDIVKIPTDLSPLSSLTKVVVASDIEDRERWDYGNPLFPLKEFLALPNLTDLVVSDAYEAKGRPDPSLWTCQPSTLHVRSLALYNCALPVAAISEVVRSCACLRTILLHFSPAFSTDSVSSPLFTWPEVIMALSSQEAFLEKICLYAWSPSPLANPDSETSWAPVGSLATFTSLKRLEITQLALLGLEIVAAKDGDAEERIANLFPPSLQRLVLEDCTYAHIPQLLDFLANLNTWYPKIKKVTVCVTAEDFDNFNTILRQKLVDCDVSIELKKTE